MQKRRLVVVLADISGYTQFMIETACAAVHGQMAINGLIESLIAQVDIPLVLQEIEGDAVFLYAADPGGEDAWRQVVRDISLKLDRFFSAFIAQLAFTIETTPCECGVCVNLDKLGLKLIVHAGEATFHEIAGRPQVSGPDVILAHRLLKNSAPGHEYVLMTEAAHALMRDHVSGEYAPGREEYPGFGAIDVRIRALDAELGAARNAVYRMSEPERARAVDRHFERVEAAWQKARAQQLEKPVRPFGWRDRLGLAMDTLLSPFVFFFHRRTIPRQQTARGRPRGQAPLH